MKAYRTLSITEIIDQVSSVKESSIVIKTWSTPVASIDASRGSGEGIDPRVATAVVKPNSPPHPVNHPERTVGQDPEMHGPHPSQTDLFGAAQPDLFGAEPPPPAVFRGDPDRVRARLEAIVAEARAAEVLPWDRNELMLYRTIVPQMVLWLPDEEAAQWRFDFEAELDRLTA